MVRGAMWCLSARMCCVWLYGCACAGVCLSRTIVDSTYVVCVCDIVNVHACMCACLCLCVACVCLYVCSVIPYGSMYVLV